MLLTVGEVCDTISGLFFIPAAFEVFKEVRQWDGFAMMGKFFLFAVLLFSAANSYSADEECLIEKDALSRLHMFAYADVESAYWMRGLIADSRPYASLFADMNYDLSPAGRIGAYVWSACSFSDGGQSLSRRNSFNEFLYAVYYGYTYEFTDEWGLDSVFYKQWVTAPGYWPDAHSRSELNFSQSLKNPYLTPYYLMRRAIHGKEWVYWEVGLTRSWKLTERIRMTTTIFGEFGDDRHFLSQYGRDPNGDSYRHGLMALNAKVKFNYMLNKYASLFAYVHQFDMADKDARDAVKHSPAANATRDLTIFGVGVAFQF